MRRRVAIFLTVAILMSVILAAYYSSAQEEIPSAEEIWRYKVAGTYDILIGDDLNQDGVKDILVVSSDNVVYMISGRNGRKIWSYAVEGNAYSAWLASDYNNDGYRDVIVLADNGIYLINGLKGILINSKKFAVDGNSKVIPDVDGDNKYDILIINATVNPRSVEIYAIENGIIYRYMHLFQFSAYYGEKCYISGYCYDYNDVTIGYIAYSQDVHGVYGLEPCGGK